MVCPVEYEKAIFLRALAAATDIDIRIIDALADYELLMMPDPVDTSVLPNYLQLIHSDSLGFAPYIPLFDFMFCKDVHPEIWQEVRKDKALLKLRAEERFLLAKKYETAATYLDRVSIASWHVCDGSIDFSEHVIQNAFDAALSEDKAQKQAEADLNALGC